MDIIGKYLIAQVSTTTFVAPATVSQANEQAIRNSSSEADRSSSSEKAIRNSSAQADRFISVEPVHAQAVVQEATTVCSIVPAVSTTVGSQAKEQDINISRAKADSSSADKFSSAAFCFDRTCVGDPPPSAAVQAATAPMVEVAESLVPDITGEGAPSSMEQMGLVQYDDNANLHEGKYQAHAEDKEAWHQAGDDSTEDEDSEGARELDMPNFQILMINPEWQKLMENLESKKSAMKGEKKAQH